MSHHITNHSYFTFTILTPQKRFVCYTTLIRHRWPAKWEIVQNWRQLNSILCLLGNFSQYASSLSQAVVVIKMSQPLQLLHPKKTSSLWWFNHMLTSWQESSPSPTASLKAADTLHPPERALNKNHLGTNMWPSKWLKDKYFPYCNHNGLTISHVITNY